jgi:hypothetical protein
MGEKERRNREAEFDNDIRSREEVIKGWNKGWDCLITTLRSLTTEDIEKEIFIRNRGTRLWKLSTGNWRTILIMGQIVFLGKMICGDQWKSLSILRGDSAVFNAEKFSQPRRKQHFTDEFLDKEKSSAL